MHRGLARIADGRVRLGLLLAVLASLVAYVALSGSGALGLGTGPAAADDCPATGAPSVEGIGRHQLFELREGLRRVVRDSGAELYEQGPADPGYMWSDDEPGTVWALSPAPSQPGGYELRWWLSNGADVVVDGFVFADGSQASDFFKRATSTRCRTAAVVVDALSPLGGRNLVWRNPDGFAQEDLLLLSGHRVYRVATVLPGVGGRITSRGRREGFSLVNELACALPGAPCFRRGTPA